MRLVASKISGTLEGKLGEDERHGQMVVGSSLEHIEASVVERRSN